MIDLETQYAWEMTRKRRLSDTIREDISWDILVEAGGATHTIKVQCLTGQTANIDWGDGNSTTATATTLTSYAHDYAAGTFTIVITGGCATFQHAVYLVAARRTVLIRNINGTGMVSAAFSFNGWVDSGYSETPIVFASTCRFASTITSIDSCFRALRKLNGIPPTLQIPAGVTTALRFLLNSYGVTSIPLSFWPTGGFTSTGTINLQDLFAYCNAMVGSIAPSQILWDSGKTFSVSRLTFYPNTSTAWLNYAAAYTDPATGITYSKIPYAWGGAAD